MLNAQALGARGCARHTTPSAGLVCLLFPALPLLAQACYAPLHARLQELKHAASTLSRLHLGCSSALLLSLLPPLLLSLQKHHHGRAVVHDGLAGLCPPPLAGFLDQHLGHHWRLNAEGSQAVHQLHDLVGADELKDAVSHEDQVPGI